MVLAKHLENDVVSTILKSMGFIVHGYYPVDDVVMNEHDVVMKMDVAIKFIAFSVPQDATINQKSDDLDEEVKPYEMRRCKRRRLDEDAIQMKKARWKRLLQWRNIALASLDRCMHPVGIFWQHGTMLHESSPTLSTFCFGFALTDGYGSTVHPGFDLQ